MLYPRLKKKSVHVKTVSAFRGYERRLKTSEGALYGTKNLSCELYPLLTVRRRRGVYASLSAPQGLLEKDALAYIDAGTLYYNGAATPLTGISPGRKQLVSMGAYICVFPDRLYYNTADGAQYGSMDANWSYKGRVRCSMCDIDGTEYPAADESAAAPETPDDGDYWIDAGTKTLSRYSAATRMWTAVESVYTKLSFTTQGQIPAAFSQYDGVEISGAAHGSLNGAKIIYALGGHAAEGGDEDGESDFIVVAGEPANALTDENGCITVSRTAPDMDFVCQCGNRLWGCRYGNDGEKNINELYCCALGDFKNWNQYLGLSTDSWRASVGSDGVWTGAVNYLGSPVFFKENCIHRISVSSSGAHQVGETVCRGVQKGSERSLAVVNETLYYKSADDICAYQGGFPERVSAALGEARYTNAAAGCIGPLYYISMDGADGESALFVLDTAKGLWMREDGLRADEFARVDGELFCLSGGTLYALRGTCGALEKSVAWAAETGMLCCEYPERKYVGRISLRAWMAQDAYMELFVEYDSSGVWEYAGRMKLVNAGTAEFPLRLRRCDHVRVKLEGRGEMKLLSVTRELTEG